MSKGSAVEEEHTTAEEEKQGKGKMNNKQGMRRLANLKTKPKNMYTNLKKETAIFWQRKWCNSHIGCYKSETIIRERGKHSKSGENAQ